MGSQSKQWFGTESIKQGSTRWHVQPQFIYVDVYAKPSPKDLPTNKHTIIKSMPERNKPARDIWFFGILVLMSPFKFGSSASFWLNFDPSKYVPAAHFGNTGMFHPRFDLLFRCIRFSDQLNRRPAGMSAEVYRWKLVDDFVK